MSLLFWNFEIWKLNPACLSTGWSRRIVYNSLLSFRYVFAHWRIKVGAMLEGMWIFREERNSKLFDAISMWHM